MRAAAVMRWFYARLGDHGHRGLCRWLASTDAHATLRFLYAPAAWKLALFPLLGRGLFAAGLPASGSFALSAAPRTSPQP